jgi:thiosulfate/3-mercaptopyruvate sulfurtransferase
MPPFVDARWVKERRGSLILADVRWYMDGRSGREAYESGHVPGAVFVDLDRWLAGDAGSGRGRHPLPSPETFAQGMSLLGIGDDSIVVAYDDQGGVIASRLVWMLRATDRDGALLDGGLPAWGSSLATSEPVVTPRNFTARPWPPERLASLGDAADASNVVLDARAPERYRGESEPIDARAGHIPGAQNLPSRGNLDESGRLLHPEVLRGRFTTAGVKEDTPVVSYCGSGVTACHNLLVLEYCGMEQGRLYPGSWSEYSAISDNPIETGDPRPALS